MNRIAILAAGAVLCTLACSDGALAAGRPGFYGGGGFGQSSFDFRKEGFDAGTSVVLASVGVTELDSTSRLDNDDSGYEFYGGYRFLAWLAVEASFLDFGSVDYHAASDVEADGNVFPVDTVLVDTDFSVDVSGLAVSALGIWPVSERFDLYLRGGIMFGDNGVHVRLSDGSTTLSGSGTHTSENLIWGAGIAVSFLDIYAARLEYRQILDVGDSGSVGKSDVEFLSLGIMVSF
jgi:OmpA-OmpF porin, OOP family